MLLEKQKLLLKKILKVILAQVVLKIYENIDF